MINRCFAFGCSYTHYAYATWADYMGANFDEYYNYAQSGASNTFIMNKIIEANERFSFNSATDYVLIMLTGFGRFSYIKNNDWINNGDLYSYYNNTKDKKVEWFIKNMWNDDWAVHMSWIAAKTIKGLLQSKNIPHKILMGIDNSSYLNENGASYSYDLNLSKKSIFLVKEIYDLLDHKESYDEWMKNIDCENKHPIWVEENMRLDGHPSQSLHYRYFKEHFSNFENEKTRSVFNTVENIYDFRSQGYQSNNFLNNFYKNYNKKYTTTLSREY